MWIKQLVRVMSAGFLGLVLVCAMTAAPAAAHGTSHHPSHGEQRLLAELWKVAFRTQYDTEAASRRGDVKIDPDGNLYLCAHPRQALAPFTSAAVHMRCQARPGQRLVLIGTSVEWSEAEGYPTEQAMRDKAVSDIDADRAAGYPRVLLDGRRVPLTKVITPLTYVDRIATTNLVGVTPDSRQTRFVAAAWMAVVRVPRGVHTVEFQPRAGLTGFAEIDARPCRPDH